MALTGIVKFFDPTKRYGFIMPHDGSPDVFFHQSSLDGAAFLQAGQWVEFSIFPDFPKPRAMRVSLCQPRKVRAYGTD